MATQKQIVQNFKRIWSQKQKELQITQVQASKKLGFTQGAFSQYLNGITELNAPAIVKIADFLQIPPTDIDPDILDNLPDIIRYPINFCISNANSKLAGHSYVMMQIERMLIHLDELAPVIGSDLVLGPVGAKLVVAEKDTKLLNESFTPVYWVCQSKKDKGFKVYSADAVPSPSALKRKFRLLGIILL